MADRKDSVVEIRWRREADGLYRAWIDDLISPWQAGCNEMLDWTLIDLETRTVYKRSRLRKDLEAYIRLFIAKGAEEAAVRAKGPRFVRVPDEEGWWYLSGDNGGKWVFVGTGTLPLEEMYPHHMNVWWGPAIMPPNDRAWRDAVETLYPER